MNLFNTTSLPQNIKKCEHITSPEYDKHAEEATQRIKEYQRQQIETKYYTYDDAYRRGFMEGYQKGYRDGFKDGKE